MVGSRPDRHDALACLQSAPLVTHIYAGNRSRWHYLGAWVNMSRLQEFVLEDRHKRIKMGRAVIAVCVLCGIYGRETSFHRRSVIMKVSKSERTNKMQERGMAIENRGRIASGTGPIKHVMRRKTTGAITCQGLNTGREHSGSRACREEADEMQVLKRGRHKRSRAPRCVCTASCFVTI